MSPLEHMKQAVYIHTNNKQLLGAKLAEFSIRKHLPKNSDLHIEILNVDEMELFRDFAGKSYLRAGIETVYNPKDLQSFTLVRFMVPELMGHEGHAVIIDADIFSFCPITELLEWDLKGAPLASCRKGEHWHSSVMLLDCAKLKHWKMSDILDDLAAKKVDYADWMQLKLERNITVLPDYWNHLDKLTEETKLLHTTTRITQPWKTGLPIDFTFNRMPKFFGIVPREPIHKLLGKFPTHYREHPDEKIRDFFFGLAKEALDAGFITNEEVAEEIKKGHIRPDFISCLKESRTAAHSSA